MATDTRPPHVIDVPGLQRTRTMPEGWLRGLVAGAEAALLSWLTVVVPAVATYIATAAAPALGEASWQAAARTGTSLWLLGHGGALQVGQGTTISLVPLGLTLVSLALVYGSTRRMRLGNAVAAGFVLAGWVGTVALLSLVAAVPAGRPAALAGATAVGTVGVALACRRDRLRGPAWWSRLAVAVPRAVRDGLAAAAGSLGALAVAALAVAAVAVVAGWDRIGMIQQSYAPDVVSSLVLVLAQVVYLPTAVVWALAWLAGPGFAVGAGTHFGPESVVTAPLPAVPLLGALPSPGSPGLGWVVVVPVIVGAGAGWWLARRGAADTLPRTLGSAALAGLGAAATVLVLASAAGGSVGPGRMATAGPDAVALAAAILAEVGGAALVAVLVTHPRTWEALGRGGSAAREHLDRLAERRREPAGPAEVPADARPASGVLSVESDRSDGWHADSVAVTERVPETAPSAPSAPSAQTPPPSAPSAASAHTPPSSAQPPPSSAQTPPSTRVWAPVRDDVAAPVREDVAAPDDGDGPNGRGRRRWAGPTLAQWSGDA